MDRCEGYRGRTDSDRFDTGSAGEGRGKATLKFPDAIRSLLMPLIETKDMLDVEYLSVRSLWDVPTDVQEATCTGGLKPGGEDWASGGTPCWCVGGRLQTP